MYPESWYLLGPYLTYLVLGGLLGGRVVSGPYLSSFSELGSHFATKLIKRLENTILTGGSSTPTNYYIIR